MPNQLFIPFKKTTEVPIRQQAREYIRANHTDTHPDAFKWDYNRWEALRKDATSCTVHVDSLKIVSSYHAQLIYILTKLPNDIGLDIPYTPVFKSAASPHTLPNLTYERAAVLFNLAALYSQLASAEDRSNPNGLKQMISHSQYAAGTLSYLKSSAIPKLKESISPADMPLDLTEPFISSLEALMLAQAQEGVWQKAVFDNYKNGIIAKLAAKVANYYGDAMKHLKDAPVIVQRSLPSGWLAHLETKQLHFEAAAQFRKSVDELEANKYGLELARLNQALTLAKRGHDVARKGSVAPTVVSDIKSLLDTLQKNVTRAERDNDLIYHEDVPSTASLPPIIEVSMVYPVISAELSDPKSAIEDNAVIFSELVAYGARIAIGERSHLSTISAGIRSLTVGHKKYTRTAGRTGSKRKSWTARSGSMTSRQGRWMPFMGDVICELLMSESPPLIGSVCSTLRSLNLPSALEALERPVGLPPSLLRKAEEVRREEGPARVETSIENVQKLAQHNSELLNQALDFLDQEAEEDEVLQAGLPSLRLASQEANKELVTKAERYRAILKQASDSDKVVRDKWDEWEANITELTWSELDLEAAVPSSTVSLTSKPNNPAANVTLSHAQKLRGFLESLDGVQRERAQSVTRAKRQAQAEDITPRIVRAAAAVEQWTEVQPSMFEDVIDEALVKYDKYREDIEAGEQVQEVLLESITERHRLFIQSRKQDPSVTDRERALQSLDLAYHKYREITRNLDEGLQFYNDFGNILTQFRETCRDWTDRRRDEMQELTKTMHAVSLEDDQGPAAAPVAEKQIDEITAPATQVNHPTPRLSPLPSQTPPSRTPAFQLPPPDSDEWEAMALPPGPPSSRRPVAAPRRKG
ncbi:hypothetical protein EIP86_005947 [Pleurotus ostreatoroseus]|nr:hypothetical protein EIP86_005947 [Pleurotus ostreatoroseus]